MIVSQHIGRTLADYRKQLSGMNRCRLRGTLNGQPCVIIPRHQMAERLRALRPTEVWFDGFVATEEEQNLAMQRKNNNA